MKNKWEIIASLKHPDVVRARERLGLVGKNRPSAYLLDGFKLAKQALDSDACVEQMFFLDPVEPREQDLLKKANDAHVECHIVSKGIFSRLLQLNYSTSARTLVTVEVNALAERKLIKRIHPGYRIMVAESIRDPRNVGVIIRTADAFGLDAVVFTADSADPWSRPSVRSTTGSILRTPIAITENIDDFLRYLKGAGVKVIGSSARAERDCWNSDLCPPAALVVGSESTGLATRTIDLCDALVNIPMFGGASSFNVTVAAGVLAYEAVRQGARVKRN